MQNSKNSSAVESMPIRWIEQIWTEMRATYGASFDRQWQCPSGEDQEAHYAGLKAHWAKSLAGLVRHPQAIRYALDNLPPHPPNLPEFKALCNRSPEVTQPMLPAPKADPAIAAAAIKAAQEIAHMTTSKPIGNKDWAWRMRDRELNHGGELESGCTMRQFHRDAWRYALKHGRYAPHGVAQTDEVKSES